MTTPSPDEVFYTYEAFARVGAEWLPIPVNNIVASMDRDRIPYVMATLECDYISDEMAIALDPRAYDPLVEYPPRLIWSIRQWAYDIDGDAYEVGRLPADYTIDPRAYMHTRTVTRDAVERTTRIECAGGELLMLDKKRISGAPLDTGATTVTDLVEWSLLDVFGVYTVTSAGISDSTVIPAGDRRNHNPEESHIDLVQPELDAIDCRLIGFWKEGSWEIVERTQDTGTVKLGTYIDGLPSDVDPIVYGFVETASRDGDWYDGILVKYDTTEFGGAITYQRNAGGDNTRGRVFTRNRSEPADNGAEIIVSRTRLRGYDFDLTARARFDIDAFRTLEVHLPDGIRSIRVRSIEWDVEASEMRIRAQSGEPEEE